MKVAFLYDGPHPMHLAWAKSVGAVPVANRFNTRTDAAALKALPDESSRKKAGGLDFFKSISLRSFGLPASTYFQGVVQGAAGIKNLDADVLICEGRMGVIPGHMFKKLRGAKTILITADPLIWEIKNFPPRWRKTYEKILSGFDGIISVSRMMYDLLPPKARKHAHIVHPSFESDYFGLEPDVLSKSIAYIGALDQRKGVDLSIEAFRECQKIVPGARFRLIGKGPMKDTYAGEKGLEFLGYVDDPGVPLRQCALFLHLARFDPYPVSVLEGMAAGLVPVVSEMTGTWELLKDIDAGLIASDPVNAGKKLAELMLDPGRIRTLSGKCREAVRGWDKPRSLRDFGDAFEKIVGKRPAVTAAGKNAGPLV